MDCLLYVQVFVREEEDERLTKAMIEHGGRKRSAMCRLYGTVGRGGGGGGGCTKLQYICMSTAVVIIA